MIEKLHQHIVSELGHSSRTDTIFVITAVVFNLVVLGVNSGIASSAVDVENVHKASDDILIVVFIVVSLIVNTISITALNVGRKTRSTLLSGLVEMYNDNNVAKYYSPTLLKNYGTRYLLFIGVIASLALLSIAVPLIIRFV